VEWLVLRCFFASDLVGRGATVSEPRAGGAPRYAVTVLALTWPASASPRCWAWTRRWLLGSARWR
jgi:hypothetical protein